MPLAATLARFVDGLVTPLLYRRAGDPFPSQREAVTQFQGAVSIASTITKSFHSPSFFADQLARRGVPLSGGHDSAILSGVTVDFWRPPPAEVNSAAPLTAVRVAVRDAAPGPVMVVDDARALVGTIELGDLPADDVTAAPTAGEMARPCPEVLLADADLAAVVAQFERGDVAFLPVVEDAAGRVLRGLVTERDALRAYNRRLLRQRAEERVYVDLPLWIWMNP